MLSIASTIVQNQPGKGLWVLGAFAFNATRFFLWLAYFVPAPLRQNPKWSFLQAVRVRIVRAYLYHASIIRMRTPLSLKPGREGNRFVAIAPAEKAYYTGQTTADPEIKPEAVGATWNPAPFSAQDRNDARVVLHFHGGGYVIGDGRDHDTGFLAKTMLANTPAKYVLCPQYRLSCNAGSRFPAALQDAISSYSYLLNDLGIPAHNIVLSGDSAGANLALSLLRYIADNPAIGLPNPICAWLWSPWVDPINSASGTSFRNHPNAPIDYVNPFFGAWGATTFAPAASTGLTLQHPYISFGDQAFYTPTPLYISSGECEVLLWDNKKLAKQMEAKGCSVALQIEENAPHDIILVGRLTSFEKEAALSARRAGTFLAACRKV